MARIPVTEAGYYDGRFIPAGGSYDDGRPDQPDVDDAAEAKARPAKKPKAKASDSGAGE